MNYVISKKRQKSLLQEVMSIKLYRMTCMLQLIFYEAAINYCARFNNSKKMNRSG